VFEARPFLKLGGLLKWLNICGPGGGQDFLCTQNDLSEKFFGLRIIAADEYSKIGSVGI